MSRRKPYKDMSFGELMVTGLQEAADVARGKRKPAKVTRVAVPAFRIARRLPTHRAPTHPGEMLLEEFLKPLNVSQAEFARRTEMPYRTLNAIVRGRRSITVTDALRWARVLGTTADSWLNLQQSWDLWHAIHSPEAKRVARLRPLRR